MEKTKAYRVEKFFPPRCPACEHPFRSHNDFSIWAGNSGRSFEQAKIEQTKRFPELFKMINEGGSTNKFEIDFLICLHCNNVTMRIDYAVRQVLTLEEAEWLITKENYTCWSQVGAYDEP